RKRSGFHERQLFKSGYTFDSVRKHIPPRDHSRKASPMTTPQENKALARRAIDEVWNKGNLAVAREVYGTDFVSHQHSHPNVRDVRGVSRSSSSCANSVTHSRISTTRS